MLKSLVEFKFPTNFIIIEDREDVDGRDLLTAFLTNYSENATFKKIYLICYENPGQSYIPSHIVLEEIKSVHFSDPCGWNKSPEHSNLDSFLSNLGDLSETVFFIDSLSFLVQYHGFCSIYKTLHFLKETAKKIVCLVHGDLFTSDHLEKLKQLSTCYVKLLEEKLVDSSRLVELIYKKPGGKVYMQKEIVFISAEFKLSSRVKDDKGVTKTSLDVKEEIKNLTTFKLDLEMSEKERRAKEDLVLPYLRAEGKTKEGGEVIYQPEVDELEDDPDDDLDI